MEKAIRKVDTVGIWQVFFFLLCANNEWDKRNVEKHENVNFVLIIHVEGYIVDK